MSNPLPSVSAADDFWQADGARKIARTPRVIVSAALRAGIIAAGMFAAGARGRKLLIYSAAGAAAIELFVLIWTRPTPNHD